MDWTQVIVIIGSLGGFLFYAKSDADKKLDRIENKIDKLEEKFSTLDSRVSRIEGVLSVRENWFEHHNIKEK